MLNRQTLRVVFTSTVVPVVLALGVNWITGIVQAPDYLLGWIVVGVVAVVVVGVILDAAGANKDEPASLLDPYDQLTESVTAELTRQEAFARLVDPDPLLGAWHTVGPPLGGHWENVRADGSSAPLERRGVYGQVHALLADPSLRGRVVIIGELGSGKTALLIKTARDLVRTSRTPLRTPVYLRMSTWRATEVGLLDWVRSRAVDDYGLDAAHAAQLIPERLVLLLDGLDEMPDDTTRAAAVRQLNGVGAQGCWLIVTSRIDEYRRLADTAGVSAVSRALLVQLEPLSSQQVQRYLTLSTRPARAQVWHTAFQADPGGTIWQRRSMLRCGCRWPTAPTTSTNVT